MIWCGWVLWHINHCRLFYDKSSLYIFIKYIWFGLVGFYDISTILDYLMLNPLYTYILNIYELFDWVLWHINHCWLFDTKSCLYVVIRVGGCPSDPMMTFAFYNSSMNTEVAPQLQPRGTESWTVGALEVSCDHCWGCSAVSLSRSSELLASSLFEVGSSSVNRALPFWSVNVISLQVSQIDVALLGIGFDSVFIPQFWSTLVSVAGLESPVHQASRHPTPLHSNYVSKPSKLGLDDGGLYAGGLSLIEDLQIGDVVLPPDSQDGAESMWKSSSFLICLQ